MTRRHPAPPPRPRASASHPETRRLRMDLAFVGTAYRGWQVQARGITVQSRMEEALHAIGHRGARIVGCSRTDSGVHALRFTAHVDSAFRERSAEAILKGLNANLPQDIRVYRAGHASTDFHARYACSGKTYRYHLYLGPVVPPALAPYVWAWSGPLDVQAMERAAPLVVGEHDFAAFTTADGREKNTLRTVTACRWERRGPLLILHVEGASFLHRMVRCIGGLLVAVGTGRMNESDVRTALTGALDGPQIPALPAQGLTLCDVNYPSAMEPEDVFGDYPKGPEFPI